MESQDRMDIPRADKPSTLSLAALSGPLAMNFTVGGMSGYVIAGGSHVV